MSHLQVSCIDKIPRMDIHNSIRSIGGGYGSAAWKHSEATAISNINNRIHSYYVKPLYSDAVDVIVSSRNGKQYLKTKNDREHENNLLSLPQCP